MSKAELLIDQLLEQSLLLPDLKDPEERLLVALMCFHRSNSRFGSNPDIMDVTMDNLVSGRGNFPREFYTYQEVAKKYLARSKSSRKRKFDIVAKGIMPKVSC